MTMDMRAAQHANAYTKKYGFKLVPLPRGTKGPAGNGWNLPGGYIEDPEQAQKHWLQNPGLGMGVVLGPSGLCSLDLDDVEQSRGIFAAFGVDIDALATAHPTISGNPARFRILFAEPKGAKLTTHKFSWPRQENPSRPMHLFEMRAGPVQDVLPPSIHPGTGKEYVWKKRPNGPVLELPEGLLTLWNDWSNFESQAKAMCPWGAAPTLPARQKDSVIDVFNSRVNIESILERNGYKRRGSKFLAPDSESGLAGVIIFDNDRCFSHHSNDVLADGHAHDSFDVFRLLEHSGDIKAAVKAAAAELGLERPQGSGEIGIHSMPQAVPAVGDPSQWPDPLPLPEGLPSVASFDPDLLPNSLRPWINDISDRVQCPPDYPAIGAVIALAAVIGRKVAIRPKAKDDWYEVANLWGCIIGRPGVLKTPALAEALRPLHRLDADAQALFKTQFKEWEVQQELSKINRDAARANALKKAKQNEVIGQSDLRIPSTDEGPQLRRYIVNDCSVEALGEVLRANPNGVLTYRDELVGLLRSLDREGNEGARSFFLSAWTGKEAHTFDCIGRGLTEPAGK